VSAIPSSANHALLKRELGLPGALFMGLGAMVGTGVFVSIGVAAGVAGPSVIPAIGLAAFVALCNALSSAQLAASHPESGGTYEYGYKYLSPSLGFAAGWMFLCAKSASAAAAALGFGSYFVHTLGGGTSATVIAAAAVIVVTLLVLCGIRRTSLVNTIVVSITLLSLMLFVALVAPSTIGHKENLTPASGGAGFLEACALMFVAYTGYGRIATMGEEVKDPRRNIPRAIILVMIVTALLYGAVAFAAVGSVGASALGHAVERHAAPLEVVLENLGHPNAARWVGVGAMTAMLGVLLNLILGLSRVALAMGRRRDLPNAFAHLSSKGGTPSLAVAGTGAVLFVLVLSGNVKLTWSFSAFTVLVYYALTNLAALRLSAVDRLYPRAFAWCGLLSCVFLAFWVETRAWLSGLGILSLGLAWHFFRRKMLNFGRRVPRLRQPDKG
jgi:APA family basic amino acid/polyamine antiporter